MKWNFQKKKKGKVFEKKNDKKKFWKEKFKRKMKDDT